MTIIDFHNTELQSEGALFIHSSKCYSACTASESSKTFKTLEGAIKWLNKRGYKEV